MSKIAQKLSVDQIDEIVVELHSKDQSRTNQGFSYHDIYRIKNGTSEEYYMEPTLVLAILQSPPLPCFHL